ncbi:polysaccharide deacetylase family protein [Saccharococcus caldoxylosilyticus]|uniref:polysaccharide deacetylase family protein n=1 Tax=Saccharococcus caldoxylosilyticus TaxID=81408 RepID=UPI001C4DDEE2|nr:polysaccharide deacetylase family protein [Parageobacillus caldoxylosilyticus]QXJ38221.1 Peptidoglycan-N-acetylmuramic acid deacetylase PdaA precursor [Parageobacillus caldoxylosilyticus]BDG34314.1 polysaccharide deacetylase familiy protein [Parageobacillus caldoxylosilyticus]BDG38083.1 polysaccharide deacetylase familiy protein [Parageobacillus caldoxylosilyticus]BDG41863.1 polysaccharide deacetylase familiy protein [Parageobacillus caldoxylosilyticus]
MLWMILACLIGGILLYGIVPTIVIRKKKFRIYREGASENNIALTFDDGPDPYYTPKLLDLLKKHQVKATFFVVGNKAKQYPDIVRRMHEEGHEIGMHNYRHISNWLILPPFLEKGLQKSADIIEDIIGKRPIYYRPPWGHFNLFTPLVQKKYITVLWTYILGDWNAKLGTMELFRRLRNSMKGGAIIVLHDNGDALGADKRAPEQMLAALELLLKEEAAKKMRWVTITDVMNVQTNKQISSI